MSKKKWLKTVELPEEAKAPDVAMPIEGTTESTVPDETPTKKPEKAFDEGKEDSEGKPADEKASNEVPSKKSED